MENDDIDDGYSGEEEDVPCMSYAFQNHPQIDESLISHVPGDAITGERMTIRLLAECADSAHVAPRQSAARQVLEALQLAVTSVEAYSEQDDVEKVFAYINKLSQDSETIVRCNLLSTLPKVASFCAEYDSPLVSLKELIETDILPIVLKAIADEDKNCNMRVRKEGYSVLKYLLNNNLVSERSIENKICDLCRGLLFHPNDIINIITAGNFIARMPPIIGEATTEKLLLPKISELCSNQHAKVREACAYFLADLACYVNPLVTENIIIPLFIKLSEDEAWCVRRACAETAVILSCLCLMETRKTVLTRVFLSLLHDPDSNVTSAACKQLGPFVTTFAQPSIMALGSNRSGDFLLIHYKSSTFEFLSRRSLFQFYEQPEENTFCMFMLPMKLDMGVAGANVASALKTFDMAQEENDQIVTNTDSTENTSLYYSDNASTSAAAICNEPTNEEVQSVDCEISAETNEIVEHDDNNDNQHANLNLNPPNPSNESENAHEEDTNSGECISDQFRNQPDVVRSCWWPDKRGDNCNYPDAYSNFEMKQQTMNARRGRNSSSENTVESSDYFNSFQFWRDPIPEFDERDIGTNDASMKDSMLLVDFVESWNKFRNEHYGRMLPGDSENVEENVFKLKLAASRMSKQNVLPQMLLDAFITMSETVPFDNRMNCAYTFPAVVLTLGTCNWFLLKNTYLKLAMDTERKIRQMMASSIHEIASILGPELATQDLIPIYNSLINDVEDVRITALNHLSCFVKLLKPYGRCQFLPHLTEFMMTDYTWNWRFRQRLSEQLIEMMDFFAPSDCWKYVSPVAFNLLVDRVSEVRLQALNLVTNLIRVVSADITILRGILAELAEQFAHSTQWARRQSFALLCSSLLKTPVLPDDMFARDVLPHLLDLSWDGIPNVRIAVARTLSGDVITYPYFSNIFSPHYDVLTQVLKRLCNDKDRDVRYFAALNTSTFEKTYEKADRW